MPYAPVDLGVFSRDKFKEELKSSLPKLEGSLKDVVLDSKCILAGEKDQNYIVTDEKQ